MKRIYTPTQFKAGDYVRWKQAPDLDPFLVVEVVDMSSYYGWDGDAIIPQTAKGQTLLLEPASHFIPASDYHSADVVEEELKQLEPMLSIVDGQLVIREGGEL